MTANQRLLDAGLERVSQRLECARAHATHGALSRLEDELDAIHTILAQVVRVLRVEAEINQLQLPLGVACST